MCGGGMSVCVTGASGYIASWIVKLLLDRGYTVKATVRDPKDSKKSQHLLALNGAKERLELFKGDLLEEGSFNDAIEGCVGVFHVASPVIIGLVQDPQAALIDPAVKGTLNVLKSCKNASSVRKVIITSSNATVIFPTKGLTHEDVVDETYFSDPAVCNNPKLWYVVSKTLAEEAARKFAEENEMKIVTLHPGFVGGPVLQSASTFSVDVMLDLINGKNPLNSNVYRWIDVRDVAFAHIRAFELPSASGRYLLEGRIVTLDEMEKVFNEFYPDLRLTRKNAEEPLLDLMYKVSMEKAKTLGIEFTPVEQSIRDAVVSLKEKGIVN